MCKDFFIDTYQVPLAKSFGADCILIILSAVDKELAKDLYQAANDLNISTLIEIHSENEAEIALSFEDSLIGINNRDLKTLKVDISNTKKLIKKIPKNKYVISESGIKSIDDMIDLWSYGIKGFLIGETLLKNQSKLKDFLNVKTN